jgi:hypothetical protein
MVFFINSFQIINLINCFKAKFKDTKDEYLQAKDHFHIISIIKFFKPYFKGSKDEY